MKINLGDYSMEHHELPQLLTFFVNIKHKMGLEEHSCYPGLGRLQLHNLWGFLPHPQVEKEKSGAQCKSHGLRQGEFKRTIQRMNEHQDSNKSKVIHKNKQYKMWHPMPEPYWTPCAQELLRLPIPATLTELAWAGSAGWQRAGGRCGPFQFLEIINPILAKPRTKLMALLALSVRDTIFQSFSVTDCITLTQIFRSGFIFSTCQLHLYSFTDKETVEM